MAPIYTRPRPVAELEGPGTIEQKPAQGTRSTAVALIGAGRVGTALAVLLQRAGHRIAVATGRSSSPQRIRRYLPLARFVPLPEAAEACRRADLVLLTVPDDRVATVCAELAEHGAFEAEGDRFALHTSGSLGLDALAAAADRGADVLSIHPLQTVPDVAAGIERLPGSYFAVTGQTEVGWEFGESLARDVGGTPFRIPEEVKPLYHAAAVFCSNYLVAVEGMAERLFRLAGMDDPLPMFEPLARASLDATFDLGPGPALTGPAARGDVGTLIRNLDALGDRAPDAVPAYVELARIAARIAEAGGRLSEEHVARVEQELHRWS
jgi:predicted short-subunit dehydrogenase-like oxidoreductase (DUF2520 family)